MDKEVEVHTHNGVSLSHQKEQNNPISATWIDLEIINSKCSESDKERKISNINELIYKTETDREISKTVIVTKGET